MSSEHHSVSQIPFEFNKYQHHDLDSFLSGENEILFELLNKVAIGESIHCIYLWGDSSSGKTHLLQGLCKQASELGKQVVYIPLTQHEEISPEILHDLSVMDIVCIDDLELVCEKIEWQQGLTWLYNELKDNHHSIIISGNISPGNIELEVEDLKSRLSWDQVFQLKSPDDALKAEILKQNAQRRSFELSDEVIEYILRRIDRDLGSLMTLLDKIDHASLAAKRKITIPFIKELIS